MNARVSFYTLGCRLNQAETAILQQYFEKEGFRVVNFKDPADVVVVNTCTVTENGDADTRRLVNKIHRMNPDARIALIGCQAQLQQGELLRLPRVHWVVGNENKMQLPHLLREHWTDGAPLVDAPVIHRKSFTLPVAGVDRQHTRANLKIQDGCDFFCSFCVIPYARGRARSREFADIVREARQLVAAGHKELVITGINVGTYAYRGKSILDVIAALEAIPELQRIRISSIEPTTIPLTFFDRTWPEGKLCRYLHIPLQSGSNRVLQAMNRRYGREDFARFIRDVYRRVPDICLGTDVIVGFPGEREDDFEETYRFLEELPLAYFHVFSYSERSRAKSRKLPGKVPPAEVDRRSRLLRELSARKRRTYMKRQIGKTEVVLFEQQKKDYWTGLTDTYIRVKVKSDADLQNRMLPVRLEQVDGQTMIGSLV